MKPKHAPGILHKFIRMGYVSFRCFQYFRGHISYFTPETLSRVMTQAGYKNVRIMGKQLYSIENAIHWARNNAPFKPYCQFELPEGLEFVNEFFKKQMETNLTSDCLFAVGVLD